MRVGCAIIIAAFHASMRLVLLLLCRRDAIPGEMAKSADDDEGGDDYDNGSTSTMNDATADRTRVSMLVCEARYTTTVTTEEDDWNPSRICRVNKITTRENQSDSVFSHDSLKHHGSRISCFPTFAQSSTPYSTRPDHPVLIQWYRFSGTERTASTHAETNS